MTAKDKPPEPDDTGGPPAVERLSNGLGWDDPRVVLGVVVVGVLLVVSAPELQLFGVAVLVCAAAAWWLSGAIEALDRRLSRRERE
ncbi:hypothetical protein BJF78_23125 [Pseudonocardia sp. CNS-139]|nr:hypothetical protein BJF78_23125 [Pseudonocardia sp. CNS-139]